MIVGSYQRTFESGRGLVTVTVTDSDTSGSKLAILTRYADTRPDKIVSYDRIVNFATAVRLADNLFNTEVSNL